MEDQTLNPGLKWGLVAGGIIILAHLGFYLAGTNLQFGFTHVLVAFFALLIFSVIAGLEQRRNFGGYIEFRPILKQIFLTYVIALLLYCIYQYAYYNYIDLAAATKERDYNVNVVRHMMVLTQSKPEEIADAVKNLEQTDYRMTVGAFFYKLLQYIIRYFVLACIVALIIRRKAPVRNTNN